MTKRLDGMTEESLLAYWSAQNTEMRGALLAFWRTLASCPDASAPLFACVIANIQRLKHCTVH